MTQETPRIWFALGGFISVSTFKTKGYWSINFIVGGWAFYFSLCKVNDET